MYCDAQAETGTPIKKRKVASIESTEINNLIVDIPVERIHALRRSSRNRKPNQEKKRKAASIESTEEGEEEARSRQYKRKDKAGIKRVDCPNQLTLHQQVEHIEHGGTKYENIQIHHVISLCYVRLG